MDLRYLVTVALRVFAGVVLAMGTLLAGSYFSTLPKMNEPPLFKALNIAFVLVWLWAAVAWSIPVLRFGPLIFRESIPQVGWWRRQFFYAWFVGAALMLLMIWLWPGQ